MKNSTAPNRKTGRMIAKNLIVLFTVALAGFCGIQAWFTDKSSAEADGINVECQAPDGIKIAVVKHNDPAPKDTEYTVGNIKLNKTNCKFLENLQLTEITSDGTDFYKPALIQTGGQAQVDPTADWSPADANQHYLSVLGPAEWHPASASNDGSKVSDSYRLQPPAHYVPHWEHTYNCIANHIKKYHRLIPLK